MGNLVTETPYSEVTATLELLDRLGVDRDGLKKFRKAASHLQFQVARLMQEGEKTGGKISSLGRNEHGHVVLQITGLDLTGEEEIKRFTTTRFRVSDWAGSCLTSKRSDGYDKNHRLIAGQSYKIALMPTKEIERDSECTTGNLRNRGIRKYGYEKPLAGIMPRVREVVSDTEMEEMGFWYIAAPHDPIKDSDGDPNVLDSSRDGDGQWLRASFDPPDDRWDGGGAFAFLVPAST